MVTLQITLCCFIGKFVIIWGCKVMSVILFSSVTPAISNRNKLRLSFYPVSTCLLVNFTGFLLKTKEAEGVRKFCWWSGKITRHPSVSLLL